MKHAAKYKVKREKKKGRGKSQIFYIFHNLVHDTRRNLHLVIYHYSVLQIIRIWAGSRILLKM